MSPENDIRRATRSAAITRQRVTASRKPTSATVAETRHKRAQIDPMLIRWSPGRQSAERSPRQTTCPSASSPHLGGRRHRNTLADAVINHEDIAFHAVLTGHPLGSWRIRVTALIIAGYTYAPTRSGRPAVLDA